MDSFRLRPGISHRCFPGRVIILDIDRDRYWQLSSRLGEALDGIAAGDGASLGARDIAYLEELGLVERTAGDATPRGATRMPDPATSAIEGDAPPPRLGVREALDVLALLLASRRAVRRGPLRAVLDGVQRCRDEGQEVAGADPVLLARRFDLYRRLVPLAALCLPDTIAFLHFAARRGCFPRLVFGVEAWPFAAHCWAQAGDCVLNDALDHARSFSPVLVF